MSRKETSKKEVRIPYEDIEDPQEITNYNKRLFQQHGMHIQGNECDLEDDPDRQQRIMRLKPATKYFIMERKG